MAITKSARARIFTIVQEIKKLLVIEVASQLEQYYGIRLDGSILIIDQLPSTEPEILHTARLLRQRIDYIKSNIPTEKNKEVEAVKQLLNEQAFSILNRFATLRMSEERGIIKETIRKEYNSEGFQIFDSITGQGKVTEQYIRYKWYLLSIFDELAIDLPSVFDRFSPYALIFPSEKAMRSLLTIINNENVTMHREEGIQPMNLWREDETIGWIYQYYNSRDEISEMRDASSAPRNSRELAVRNQFFTPRYVVQFLTDNSLGRIWYEMTKGNTGLTETCQYLIRRPKELFLDKGNSRPENEDEETDYIEYRLLKDPREILMLDPACGSMHFGLYSFDLFEKIYVEAWDNHPDLLLDLRNSITRQQFIKQIPEFIIRYNIHGVDIDPRALQIAALSLWLRAQKSFDKLNLEADNRPQITKSNLVLAEAMPGNAELLSELVKPLDAPMRKLVTSIWDLMKMAGETGLLLRIEEEIDKKINEIADELSDEAKGAQLKLDSGEDQLQAAERSAFYSTKKYRDVFLENASTEVFRILKELAETANEGEAYQKLLFADDAARGFAFIELCKKKYEVILMNPPFGAASIGSKEYIYSNYEISKNDLAAVFVERMHLMINEYGLIGAISTRTIFFLGSYEKWRERFIINNTYLKFYVDLGGNVLDAMVETAAYIIDKKRNYQSLFINLTKNELKDQDLIKSITSQSNIYIQNTSNFKLISNKPLCYWIDNKTKDLFENSKRFEKGERASRQGTATSDKPRFVRNYWEIDDSEIYNDTVDLNSGRRWISYMESEESLRFFNNANSYVNWRYSGNEIKALLNQKFGKGAQSESTFFKHGITWAYRTANFSPHIVSKGAMSTNSRFITLFDNDDQLLYTCALWNSKYFDYIIKLSMEWVTRPTFKNGIINQSPFPELNSIFQKQLIDETIFNYKLIENVFNKDETSLYFEYPPIDLNISLNESIDLFNELLLKSKNDHIKSLERIDKLVYSYFGINHLEMGIIEEFINHKDMKSEGAVFDKSSRQILEEIFSWIFGAIFGRWDLRLIKDPMLIQKKPTIFSPLPNLSPGRLINSNNTKHNTDSSDFHYPIKTLNDGSGVVENGAFNNIISRFREALEYLYTKRSNNIENEFILLLEVRDVEEWINNPNKFFNSHLSQYSKNNRLSPIYWPISTTSGSYTIWLYYPILTDQTLVSVINNSLQPKIDEVVKLKRPLELNTNIDNKGLKELKELNDFEHELEEMKKELLRITALPYKPNHDDGVLITAAPLNKLFRHTKWRKATEDCWKELEKGEYDWAHLAYSIWPDRVTKKCKKDLSMAIAHGIENICEVKPKEKKEKVNKVTKNSNPINELNFGE